ncbi:MAG: DUF4412 domain-containing protein [Candidatus Margulisiibacteriota bacterium]|jgi:outer membrane lipoprotein-sorting protein
MIKKCALIFTSVFVLSTIASALEFSADVVTNYKGKTGPAKSKMYMGNNKWRMESEAAGKKSVSIILADKKIVWVLMPESKMYLEQKLTPDKMMGMGEKAPGEVTRKKIGREKVDGIMCDKYEVTYKGPDGESKMYQWLSSDNWPIKSAAVDGSWSTEFKNLKKGAQPGALFTIPAGYKKMPMPDMGSMKGMKPEDMQKMMKGFMK